MAHDWQLSVSGECTWDQLKILSHLPFMVEFATNLSNIYRGAGCLAVV